jgi:hypothetical protein
MNMKASAVGVQRARLGLGAAEAGGSVVQRDEAHQLVVA